MKTAPWIIIIILIAVIFLLRECTPVPECPECPKVDTITLVVHDTIMVANEIYVPRVYYRDTGSTRYVIKTYADTVAIINHFFARNYYADTLVNDTNAFILLEDTVAMNQITWRRKTVRVFPATIYTTQIVTKQADPRRMMYVGLGVGRSVNSFGLAPSLLYISKRQSAYSLSYDVLNKDAYFTMYFKLSFKK
jgi:hypothetical protein